MSCRQYSYQLDSCLYSGKGKCRRCAKLWQQRAKFGLPCTKQNLKPGNLFWKGTELPGGCQPSGSAAPREAGTLFSEQVGWLPALIQGFPKLEGQYFLNWVLMEAELKGETVLDVKCICGFVLSPSSPFR